MVHVTLKDRRLLDFIHGRHTAAVAIAVAATTPTKLAVAVFPPDVTYRRGSCEERGKRSESYYTTIEDNIIKSIP